MKTTGTILLIVLALSGIWYLTGDTAEWRIKIEASTDYKTDQEIIKKIKRIREQRDENLTLYELYKEIPVIDVHSHDASLLDITETRNQDPTSSQKEIWKKFGIDKTVLFGDVSEPSAIKTDNLVWKYYQKYPDLIYPSFSGFPLSEEESGLKMVEKKLEQGYMNIGEVYSASTFSTSSNVIWKGEHPYWGILPDIYELAATYKVPILLHIDPPKGTPILYLQKALTNHPETIFVFAHANVFNTPQHLRALLRKHENLYIDFFAGFTRYNTASRNDLADFVPIIEEFRERVFLGSDSGFDIGLENSYQAMYELLDMLTPETVAMVSYQNFERIIEEQPPTDYQIKKIKKLASELNYAGKRYQLNKRQANELIFLLEQKKTEDEI